MYINKTSVANWPFWLGLANRSGFLLTVPDSLVAWSWAKYELRKMPDKNHPLDILMISYWDFQDEGMQVTQQTPLFFASRGNLVTFMVHSETTAKPSQRTFFHPRLRVLRFDLPFKWVNKIGILRRPRQLLLFAWYCIIHAALIYRKGRRPDVIYAAEADAVFIGTILKRIYKVPLVLRFYGVSRIASHFDFTKKALKLHGLKHFISKIAMTRRAEMVIVTDDGSRGLEIIRAINPHAQDIRFWKNGVDRPHVRLRDVARIRSLLKISRRYFILLTLCRLDRWKGVDLAIRALRIVVDKGTGYVRLVIVGHGPERLFLQKLAKKNDLGNHVVFVGAVPHSDVYSYYHQADIFLSLYRYSNVGNPLWEALNAGCCIITLDTGATGEVICSGKNGILVNYSQDETKLVKKLAETIHTLYLNPRLRKKLKLGARDYAIKYFWTWERRLAEELKAIRLVVEKYCKKRKYKTPQAQKSFLMA